MTATTDRERNRFPSTDGQPAHPPPNMISSRAMRVVPKVGVREERPTSPRKLLIVDRDADSAAELDALVAPRGYETAYAGDATSAVEECRAFAPDLAIVDLDMSEPAALRLGLKFVDVVKLPFIVYSQVTDVLSRVVALQLGADNVLAKPMEQRLLLAHLDAAMRRIEHHPGHARYATFEDFGPYQINRINRNVRYRGNAVRLSGTEFELFWILANNFGEIVDRRHVIETLGLSDDEIIGRTIDQRIFRLRNRMVAAGAPKDAIKSFRGKGFVLTGSD